MSLIKPTAGALALVLATLLAQPVLAAEAFFLHTDHTGSVVMETDIDRNITWQADYEPYGLPTTPIEGPGYTGHVHDQASGLIYMQQRYYDPAIGQFLSVDPMAVDTTNAFNFNRYNYAAGNPYRFWDPDGLCPADSQRKTCIEAPAFESTRSGGQTIQASETTSAAMVASREIVAGGTDNQEPMAFIVRDDSGRESGVMATGVRNSSDGDGWRGSAVPPEGSTGVLHGHLTNSLLDLRDIGDAGPLLKGLPNAAVTVDGSRVGVTEIVDGRLQFRMLRGEMTPTEISGKRQRLAEQQKLFYREIE